MTTRHGPNEPSRRNQAFPPSTNESPVPSKAGMERDHFEVEGELLQADNDDLWPALRSAMSVAEGLTELLTIERDEVARLRAELKEREDSLRTQQLEIRNRDEELAKHEFGLYAQEIVLKIECPAKECAASFVGQNSAYDLVSHYLGHHSLQATEGRQARIWTARDAAHEPTGDDAPQFVQGFYTYVDRKDGLHKTGSNKVVFQHDDSRWDNRHWQAMRVSDGDGHLYSWHALLSENSPDAFEYLQEVPDPRKKKEDPSA